MKRDIYRPVVLVVLMGITLAINAPLVAVDSRVFSDQQAISIVKGGKGIIDACASEEPKKLETIGTDWLITQMARAVIALGEFGTTQSAVEFLNGIKKDPALAKVHCPDLIMFSDEYRQSMRRVGEVVWIGRTKFEGESDEEAGLGTGLGRSLTRLVEISIERLNQRKLTK